MHSDYQHQTKCFISQTSGPCPGFNIDSSFRHNLGEIRGNGVAVRSQSEHSDWGDQCSPSLVAKPQRSDGFDIRRMAWLCADVKVNLSHFDINLSEVS